MSNESKTEDPRAKVGFGGNISALKPGVRGERVPADELRSVSEGNGFTSSKPASAQVARSGGRRRPKSRRTVQLNLRLTPETYEAFWAAAEAYESDGEETIKAFLAALLRT